ncbi:MULTISPECIES: hypothetical protein [Acidithrix]|uniref:Cytochrome b561 domain-containing protein n=1 Tax=Acidithrix ferrooxidans TaxID=1280514 RepID=A0A0D8HGP8_9ACTN|nr:MULTISPECIES: hypothetical protein [Acidithrix]KJF16937.1 hypothetical protein AXFE_22200 [Acidithrix ferrooxidans]CAG4904093.1 unnamed protein product [Acidithrix sp. C25]
MIVGSVTSFHAAWAWIVIIGNALAGIWTLLAIRYPALRTRALWWFTIFVQGAIYVQVLTGIYLVASEHKKMIAFHPFYGFVAIIASGFLFAYRDSMRHRLYWLYGIGGLFVSGLGIRAYLVAQSFH